MSTESRFEPALLSPRFVGAKDRAGWVGLFARDGFVEDPVEAGRYEGSKQIEIFWDTFIGPQPSVAFDIKRDFVGGNTLIRQATVVSVTEADPNDPLQVPALLRYTIDDGQLQSLQAVWVPRDVIAWFLRRGLRGMRALSRHSVRMMGKAGLRNGLSFGGTLVGGLDRARAQAIVDAVRSSEARQWSALLGQASITVGHCDEEEAFSREPGRALECVQSHARSLSRLDVDQVLLCGNHIGAFLVDRETGGALAVMLRATGHGAVESMCAIWGTNPRVLTLPEATRRTA